MIVWSVVNIRTKQKNLKNGEELFFLYEDMENSLNSEGF